MPYSIDFKVQNTNAEAVDAEIELTDLAGEISPLFYEFPNLQPGTTVLTCSDIPDDKYFDGTVRFKPIGQSEFLESLPVSINRFRTDAPIISLDFTPDTGAGGEATFDVTLPTGELSLGLGNEVFIDTELEYDTPVVSFGTFVPLPIQIDPNDPNYLWKYDLLPESGFTGDQTELVFDESLSTATRKAYEVTTVTNEGGTQTMVIYLEPFKFGETGGASAFNSDGVRVIFTKPATQTPTYTLEGEGEFQLRFELMIKGIDDNNWDSLEQYDGIRNNDEYLSSYDPQIIHTQIIRFEI